jgi:hypothetical protein
MSHSLPDLPNLTAQAQTLIDLGVHDLAGLSEQTLRAAAEQGEAAGRTDALLAIDPGLAPPSALAPLLRRGDRPGFVVEDMTDVDDFAPAGIEVPGPVYLVAAPDRGDEFASCSPEEVLPVLEGRGRTPLLLTEGLHWVLQQPGVLERTLCFMTIGSRLRKTTGRYDARTPALWISNGTGRDGRDRKDAPKLGWCWWRNRHTWLGIASAAGRAPAA